MVRPIWILLALLSIGVAAPAQTEVPAPPVVVKFMQRIGQDISQDKFYDQAREGLWEVYPQSDATKEALVEYVRHGKDGPALGFAGIALIPFRDAATIRPLIERAMQPRTDPATRACFLNAGPYILGIGDAMYMGEGKIDSESKEMASGLIKAGDEAARIGTGRIHAHDLHELLNLPEREKSDSDYGLAVWHLSAYLIGTLDLRDEPTLSAALKSPHRTVFQNVSVALSFAANRDFLSSLEKKMADEVTPAMEQAVADEEIRWWKTYLDAHPDGNSRDAVLEGFRLAGYHIESDLQSPQSVGELLRALDDRVAMVRYNAHRLLNETYQTHFDLDVAFLGGKYALSFLDPSSYQKENERRMKQYWRQRFDWKAPIEPAASQADTAVTPSGAGSPAPESLGEAARRIREQKKAQQNQPPRP